MCEHCAGTVSLYQQTSSTKLVINTMNGASALYVDCMSNDSAIPDRSAFVIHFCPNCGRDLSKVEDTINED